MPTLPTTHSVLPVSDGARIVEAVAPGVTRFKSGYRVATLFDQDRVASPPTDKAWETRNLGGFTDGVLRQYGAYDEEGLVAILDTLDFQHASTLFAAVAVWNGLYSLARTMILEIRY